MEKIGMVLCVHGEVTDPAIDIFDREAVFLERVLTPLLRDFPGLKIVLEHITTADSADFVAERGAEPRGDDHAAAPDLNRNALFEGGLRPHAYCLPVVKREKHRLAVRAAACRAAPSSSSAPTARRTFAKPRKAAAAARASGTRRMRWKATCTVFDEEGALDRFEGFASEHGPRFYGLPLNEGSVTLERTTEVGARAIPAAGSSLVPFHAGQTGSAGGLPPERSGRRAAPPSGPSTAWKWSRPLRSNRS
jgi:dihydroorotase